MLYIRVALVLLLIVIAASGANVKQAHYKNHIKKLKEFSCGDPQPRIMELKDVISDKILTDYGVTLYEIRPHVTVLHRCESSGYCKDDQRTRCMPSEQKDVNLMFQYSDRTIHYLPVIATNHTACSCMLEDDNIDNNIK